MITKFYLYGPDAPLGYCLEFVFKWPFDRLPFLEEKIDPAIFKQILQKNIFDYYNDFWLKVDDIYYSMDYLTGQFFMQFYLKAVQ